ncbi:hypothetical protein ACQ4PT_043511 [Festuca glaucescens]
MQGGSGKKMQGGSEKDMLMSRGKMCKEYTRNKQSSRQSGSVKLERVWESKEQLSEVLKEIRSLETERKDLLDNLTPSYSHWKRDQIHGRKEKYMSENTASASVQQQVYNMSQNQNTSSESGQPYVVTYPPRDDNKELANLFSVILEDMEDLGHRMLSMAYVVSKPSPSLALYKANELVSRTSRLRRISEEFYNYTKDNNMQEEWQQGQEGDVEEEGEGDDFLFLCRNYFSYKNELVLNLEKEKEKEREKEKEEEEKEKEEEEKEEKEEKEEEVREKKNKDYDNDNDYVSTIMFMKNIMDFRQRATLSSMHFTQYTPATIPSHASTTGSTLQIYSIKIVKLSGNLNWPLKVCGVVAARDTVDRKRNILFSRSRSSYQLLTEKDPFLHLTGPSRAIVAVDPVDFEVVLEINEGAESPDRASISLHKSYYAKGSTSLFFHSSKCIVELSVGRFDTPLQATIVGLRVAKGIWPFKHGCRVVCAEVNGNLRPREVVLLDNHGKLMRAVPDGYLRLSRNVVSVDHHGPLRVAIQAYSDSGPVEQGHVDFPVQYCQTSKRELSVGNSELEIVVAWSLLVKDKLDLLLDCPAIERSVAQP